MQQVFTNLLDNAAKFSPPGTEIDVTVRSAGGLISVAVSDRGPGITAGDERRIFEK
ncbi:MAG: sensor histidine kinase, partial [Phycisphaerae bacterium]